MENIDFRDAEFADLTIRKVAIRADFRRATFLRLKADSAHIVASFEGAEIVGSSLVGSFVDTTDFPPVLFDVDVSNATVPMLSALGGGRIVAA